MAADYLTQLKYLGLISRIKRLSDNTIASGREVYKHIDIGIEPNWFLIFTIIEDQGETTISYIASSLKFAHPSVISIVKKMDAKGYLKIRNDSVDKRKKLIRLSLKAKEQMPIMEKVWQACEKGVSSIFKNDNFINELEQVELALQQQPFFDRVLHHLEADEIELLAFSDHHTDAFAELNRTWITQYFNLEPNDQAVLNDPKRYIIETGGHIEMALFLEKPIGTTALIPRGNNEVELARMAVHPKYQGKGIGAKLLDRAITIATKQKRKAVILYSNTILEAAIHLYKKRGFQIVPLEDNSGYQRANIKMKLML